MYCEIITNELITKNKISLNNYIHIKIKRMPTIIFLKKNKILFLLL